MAHIVIIGGSGHVGTYLVPQLVARGDRVTNVSRGASQPYVSDPAWAQVETLKLDRTEAEANGTFASAIADLHPDIVIDMVSFDVSSTRQLVDALRGRVEQFIHCSTIWVYGKNAAVPATEDDPMDTFGEYGTKKAEIEAWLLADARRTGFPATIFRPGHIVGPGWLCINPVANADPSVFSTIARGEALAIPNLGLETVHHVHAADLAQMILCMMANRTAASGEAFNAVSAQALNLKGFAESMYRWFGHEPNLTFQPFEEWARGQDADQADVTWQHMSRSSCFSIEKARVRLGYHPRYSSLDAVKEAVIALIKSGEVDAPPNWPK